MLAKLPSSVSNRVIYKQRHVITESKDGYVNYKYDGFLDFNFLDSKQYVGLNMYRNGSPKDGFVIETLVSAREDRDSDCRAGAVPWVQKWLFKCRGNTRIRNMTIEESEQMETFIANPQGKIL